MTVGNRTIGGDFSVVQPWWETLGKFSNDFYVLSIGGRVEALKGRWGAFLDGYWIFGKETSTAAIPGSYSATGSISRHHPA